MKKMNEHWEAWKTKTESSREMLCKWSPNMVHSNLAIINKKCNINIDVTFYYSRDVMKLEMKICHKEHNQESVLLYFA